VRLTLRTLLAYLDDTLEPAQAKLIGQKVAESDTAQELIARIKQVTRRRRLTIPPPTGPGSKLDPNTVAEYLDNTLNPDQTAEVEQVCLGSDVHLADVAACHQILTLVLGEPVLIPPSSRQRMYGLVKGRESIPFRRPAAHADSEPEAAPDLETDETLRLGLPPYRTRGSWSSQLAVIGGGLAAAILLFLAIWQALRQPLRPEPDTNGQAQAVKNKGTTQITTEREKTQTGKNNEQPTQKAESTTKKEGSTASTKKEGPATTTGKNGSTEKEGNGNAGKKGAKEPAPKTKPGAPADVPIEPPSTKEVEIGQFRPAEGVPGPLLQRVADNGPWRVQGENHLAVFSNRPLVSLPGCPAMIDLASGLRLTLWGALPQELLFPPLKESRVVLHYNPTLDADLTLQRGRIVLANLKQKDLRARVRFDNPTNPNLHETWDVTLEEPGTEVLIDLWHFFPLGEPFYENPTPQVARSRVGPTAVLHLIVRAGSISLHRDDRTVGMSAPPGPALMTWNSLKGSSDRFPLPTVPDWATAKPTLPKEIDPKVRPRLVKARDEMLRARDSMLIRLKGLKDEDKERVDVALARFMESTNADEHVLVAYCYGALDDLPHLIDALADEDRTEVRLAAVDVLRSWITDARDNDYKLLAEVRTKYTKVESGNILRLLHSFSAKDYGRVETYELLINNLNNSKIALRELSAWHLYRMAPALAANIPYLASAPQEQRVQAQQAWTKLLQDGKLPPRQPPPPGARGK
jgi:hypothetical protein